MTEHSHKINVRADLNDLLKEGEEEKEVRDKEKKEMRAEAMTERILMISDSLNNETDNDDEQLVNPT